MGHSRIYTHLDPLAGRSRTNTRVKPFAGHSRTYTQFKPLDGRFRTYIYTHSRVVLELNTHLDSLRVVL